MKPLQLYKPTVLIINGIPGAGKSFFAKQFALAHHVPRVSGDKIRAELFNDPQFTSSELDIVHRIAFYMIHELLVSKQTFIIDTTLTNIKINRMKIERIAREAGYDSLNIWVQTDVATARQRSLKRNPRKTDDQFNPSISNRVFEYLAKQFTPPTQENHVVVSGKHTFAAQHATVMRKLMPDIGTYGDAPHKTQGHSLTTEKIIIPTPTERPLSPPVKRTQRRIDIG
jgi:predicted kinase